MQKILKKILQKNLIKKSFFTCMILSTPIFITHAYAQDATSTNISTTNTNTNTNTNLNNISNVKVILTNDEPTFRKNWDTEANQKTTPQTEGIKTAKIGEKISTMIFFQGCTPNAQGKCNVIANYRVYEASGKTSPEMTSIVWNEPPSENIELAKNQLDIIFEKTDSLGRYEINIKVRDQVSGQIFPVKTAVILE